MVDSRVLPKLKRLDLQCLGRLVSFFQGEVRLDMASLEVIIVGACKNLKRLPLGPQSAPNLKKLKAKKEWFEELEWRDGSITKSRLQPLFREMESSSFETSKPSEDSGDRSEWFYHAEISGDESERSNQAEASVIEDKRSDQPIANHSKEPKDEI